MRSSTRTLRSRLATVRRRLWLLGGVSAVVWGAIAAVGLCLATAWLDLLWDLPPQGRIAALAVAACAGLALLAAMVVASVRGAVDAAVARRVDRAGAAGGQIVAGFELDGPLPAVCPWPSPALSAGLARMAVARAAALAGEIPTARAAPARGLWRSLAVLAALAAATGLLAACLPGLFNAQWQRMVHPWADVPPYSVLEFEVEPGDTRVAYGDPLDIRARVSGGLAQHVDLVLESGGQSEVLPMFPEPDGRWRANLARVTEPAEYFIRAEQARSRRYAIAVNTVPRIEKVRVRIELPSYAQSGPPYEGPVPKDGIAGLKNTQVTVYARSNRPLSRGWLTLSVPGGAKRLPMKLVANGANEASGREVVGRFSIQQAGKFRVDVDDVNETSSRQGVSGPIVLVTDERPLVRLVQPAPISLATPTAVLPVVVAAEDDYGVARLQLFRVLNDSRPRPMDVALGAPPPRRPYIKVDLPLAGYGLEPGDTIKLFARAEDNDPDGAKGAESPVATVRIIAQADFERMLRREEGLQALLNKYNEAARRMEDAMAKLQELQDKLAKMPPDNELTAQQREELDKLRAALAAQAEEIRRLAERSLGYDIDKNLTARLRELADALSGGANELGELGKQKKLSAGAAGKMLKGLAKKLGRSQERFRKEATEPLELLEAALPLMIDAVRFIELAQRQQDLAERMATVKGAEDKNDPALAARMRELRQEQQALREELGKLLDDIETHARALPEHPQLAKLRETALGFAGEVRRSGATEAMKDAETALGQSAGTRAHQKATEAAEILARFIKRCQGIAGDSWGCLGFMPSLSDCIGDTIGQLLGDMGYGSGSGSGGFTAQRGRFGVYGSLPGMGQSGRDAAAANRAASVAYGPGSGGSNPDHPGPAEPGAAHGGPGGWSEGVVPPTHRRRARQYLQRLSEEIRDW